MVVLGQGRVRLVRLLAVVLLALTASCTAPNDGFRSPEFNLGDAQVTDSDNDGDVEIKPFPFAVYDPLEGFNRGVYKFNTLFDRYIFLPLIDVYRFVLPEYGRDRVHDFFSNLTEMRNATNGLLQGRPAVASRAIIRFLVNSTVGLLGLYDVAGKAGVAQQPEDFGQTLGWWGFGSGPYLVLPVLGPSNARDTSGLIGDTVMANTLFPIDEITETVYFNPAVYLLFAIDARNSVDFEYFESGSPFEYDFVRFLYTKKRYLDIGR